MHTPIPFFCEVGSGPAVVCLHANASTSRQWLSLMETLAPSFHVLAVDAYGVGKSPPWPMDRTIGLREEAALLEPIFVRAGTPLVLIGHSYGAATALIAALSQPERVRAMVLYEPTLFALLEAEAPALNETEGLRRAVAAAVEALKAGDPAAAARWFIDFWMEKGAWSRMPETRQASIAASIVNLPAWAQALFDEPTPLAAFSRLTMPVLYMMGKKSPPASRGVGRLLTRILPQVELVEFDGVGHMGPITHSELFNQTVLHFLNRL